MKDLHRVCIKRALSRSVRSVKPLLSPQRCSGALRCREAGRQAHREADIGCCPAALYTDTGRLNACGRHRCVGLVHATWDLDTEIRAPVKGMVRGNCQDGAVG